MGQCRPRLPILALLVLLAAAQAAPRALPCHDSSCDRSTEPTEGSTGQTVLAAGLPTVGVSVLGGVTGAAMVFGVAVLSWCLFCRSRAPASRRARSRGPGSSGPGSTYRSVDGDGEKAGAMSWTPGTEELGGGSVDLGEIDISSPLGRGGFGMVYKGSLQGDTVALKVIEHDGKLLEGRKEPLEAVLSGRVEHPNIVKTIFHQTRRRDSLFASLSATGDLLQLDEESATTGREQVLISGLTLTPSTTDDFSDLAAKMRTKAEGSADRFRTWIVMEYCDGGSLAKAIQRGVFFHEGVRSRPNMRHILLTASEVAGAVACLHGQKIVHGDLKGQNILLKRCAEDERGFYCKVADFGLSRVVTTNGHLETHTYGTVRYMPPELLRDGLLVPAADVYSFGVLLWQLVSGERPFPRRAINDVMSSVINGKRPQVPACCPQSLAALIQDCWQHGYKRRPDFDQIVDRLNEMRARCEGDEGPAELAMDEGSAGMDPEDRMEGSVDSSESGEGEEAGCSGGPPPCEEVVTTGVTASSTTPEDITFGRSIPDSMSSWSAEKGPPSSGGPSPPPWSSGPGGDPPPLAPSPGGWSGPGPGLWGPATAPSPASSPLTSSTPADDSARDVTTVGRRLPISASCRLPPDVLKVFVDEPLSSRSDTANELASSAGTPGPAGTLGPAGVVPGAQARAAVVVPYRSGAPVARQLPAPSGRGYISMYGRGRSAGTRDGLRSASPGSSQGSATGSKQKVSVGLNRHSAGPVPFKRQDVGPVLDRSPAERLRGLTAPTSWRPVGGAPARPSKRGSLRPRPQTAPPRGAKVPRLEGPLGRPPHEGLPRVRVRAGGAHDALLDTRRSTSAASTASTYFSAHSYPTEDAGDGGQAAVEAQPAPISFST